MAGPVLDGLSVEYAGKVVVAKLDVDTEPEIAGKYGVMSIPTLILFKKGEVAKTLIGFSSKEEILKELGIA
jgi:thioredoxin 1